MAYKQDQGRYARLAAFWSLAVLVFYGCYSFHTEVLGRYLPSLAQPLFAGMKKIPILGLNLNGSLLIGTALLAVAIWVLHRWLNSPKIADLLIETEHELRKTTWPTMPEAVNSSIIVIVCVVFLMAFLAGADWVLGQWATRILIGSGS
jgi:preprotein translocase SecE subunit